MRKHIGDGSKRRGAKKTMAVVLCACMIGTHEAGGGFAGTDNGGRI